RAGGLRRRVDGLFDLLVGGQPRRQALALQQVEHAAASLDVVVGEVQLGDLGVGELEVVAVLVALEQLALDDPVDFGVDLREILGFDRVELTPPQVDDLLDLRVGLAGLQVVDGAGVVLALNVERAGLPATGETHRAPAGQVVADLADRADRVVEREVAERHARFDHLQHQRRGADLQHGRGLGHVRVTDDDVQAAVFLGVGVRLVAGVDDRAASGGGARHAFPDVLGPLAQAEGRGLRGLQHFACATDQLAGNEERQQHVGNAGKFTGADDQIILVATVGIARRVGVVLEQVDVAAYALVGEALLGVDQQVFQDAFAGTVVGDQLDQAVALGGRVLRVTADIEVTPRAVAKEHVAAAAPRQDPAEQIARNLVGRQSAVAVERAGDTEFGLDAHDPTLHAIERTGCAEKLAATP